LLWLSIPHNPTEQSSLQKKRVHELTQTLEISKKRIADLD